MHLSTAVRTENLTHKRICLALCVYPAFGLSKLLHHIPCFSVNDRLMGIRKDHYLVTVISYSSLILIGKLLCTEIHSISHIFRFFKHSYDTYSCPFIWLWHITPVLVTSISPLCLIIWRFFHLFLSQYPCNLIWSDSLNCHPEYPADNCRSFLVNEPVILIFRIFDISVWWIVGNWFPVPALCLQYCLYLAAAVTQIPFVHDI